MTKVGAGAAWGETHPIIAATGSHPQPARPEQSRATLRQECGAEAEYERSHRGRCSPTDQYIAGEKLPIGGPRCSANGACPEARRPTWG